MAPGRHRGMKLVAGAVALMCVLVGCSSDPGPATASAAFDGWASDAGADGGGVAYVRSADGTSQLLATGGDAASDEPLDPEDRVRVGSISKVFTAVMVMQLVDEGSVDLDEPVDDYVEDLPVGAGVTVRQLLAHRSGIPNYTATDDFIANLRTDPGQRPSPTDLLDLVAGESDFNPGAWSEYSNSNYIVLGMLIEAVDERSLNDALGARITTPLGLSRTGFDDGNLIDVAAGFTSYLPGGTSASNSYRGLAMSAWAAGGLVTTVGELATFLDALMFDDLVSAESLKWMVLGLEEPGAAYGLGLHAGPDFGVGHGGSIMGFNSIAEVDPETGELIVVVVNNDSLDATEASQEIWKIIR